MRPAVAADLLARTVAGDGWPHKDTVDGLRLVTNRGASCWLAVDDGVIVGGAGTHGPVDASGRVEIGYGLARPYRGRGPGAELVATFSRWLLWQPAVREVVAVVPDGNVPSRRALERAGFVPGDAGPGGRRYVLSGAGRHGTADAAPGVAPAAPRRRSAANGTPCWRSWATCASACWPSAGGLSERDARHSPVPSGTSLLGLVKHVAAVEVLWLHHAFAGYDPLVVGDGELADSDTVESVLAHYPGGRRGQRRARPALYGHRAGRRGGAVRTAARDTALAPGSPDRGGGPARRTRRHPARAARRPGWPLTGGWDDGPVSLQAAPSLPGPGGRVGTPDPAGVS